MVDEFKLAGDRLRTAWDNYYRVYSNVENLYGQNKAPYVNGFPPELSRRFDAELAFISSYEPKIQEIKVAISCARNYSSGLAPINSLPPEILTRIFHLVLARPCDLQLYDGADAYKRSRYPDRLAQVCTLWRRTALSFGPMWCHIDLSVSESHYDGLIKRAGTHLGRAGELPIELHVDDRYLWRPHECCYKLYDLTSEVSSYVETLEFVMGEDHFRRFHSSVLRELFLGEDMRLTKLVLWSQSSYDIFISAGYDDDDDNLELVLLHFQVDLTFDELERGFAPLTVLHLRGVFPRWSSAAYHGLVDLRLLSTRFSSHINVVELETILKSSPGLQILHFGLVIQDIALAINNEATPVCLQDLQVVKIFPATQYDIIQDPSSVLRLLTPGSKPLRLCFGGNYIPDAKTAMVLESFFARSKVARFYTRFVFPPMRILLCHAAHLECVVLDDLKLDCRDELPSAWLQVGDLGSLPRLKSLYITRSVLSEADLRLLVGCCPEGTVICTSDADPEKKNEGVGISAEKISKVFPNVKTTEYTLYLSDDPTADWDILD